MLQCLPVSRISEVFYRTAADPDSIRQAVFVTCRPLVQRCLATSATVASFRLHVDLIESVLLHVTASAVNCQLAAARARVALLSLYVIKPERELHAGHEKKTCFN